MRILLANPPWKKGDDQEEGGARYGVRAGSRWPFTVPAASASDLAYVPFPFFMAYAAAFLAKDGFEIMAVDAIAEGLSNADFDDRVGRFDPACVVLETSTASWPVDRDHAHRMRGLFPDAVIVLTGPHASSFPDRALNECEDADCCLTGEYEWSLRTLARALRDNDRPASVVPGLAYRTPDGRVELTPRGPLGDIDELPWPAWEHFPMHRYQDPFCGITEPMVNMVASRGCPFHCSFCLWPEVMYGGTAYRVRNADDVADEMQALVQRYGFKVVYFDDDTFNIGRERMQALSDAILARGLDVKLAVMARADTMDEASLAALHRAGLHAIKYGVESGSQEVLDRAGKKLDLDAVRRTVAQTKALGVKVHLTFTLGLAGETKESMRQSMELALELDPDSLQISYATPFPGTAFHRWSRDNGFLMAEDMALYDGSQGCVARTEALDTEDIEAGMEAFRAAWRAHVAKRQEQIDGAGDAA